MPGVNLLGDTRACTRRLSDECWGLTEFLCSALKVHCPAVPSVKISILAQIDHCPFSRNLGQATHTHTNNVLNRRHTQKSGAGRTSHALTPPCLSQSPTKPVLTPLQSSKSAVRAQFSGERRTISISPALSRVSPPLSFSISVLKCRLGPMRQRSRPFPLEEATEKGWLARFCPALPRGMRNDTSPHSAWGREGSR